MTEIISDEQLVLLTINKDKEYFAQIVDRYQAKLLRYITRITNVDNHTAEDILQDSFIKAYRNLNNFDTGLKFSSWIYRIVHNEVISSHRKSISKGRDHVVDIDNDILQNISDDIFDIRAQIDNTILAQHLQRALSQIDTKYQEIIILRYFEDKDYKEISDILKKPINTIATHLRRAKQHMRVELIKLNTDIYGKE